MRTTRLIQSGAIELPADLRQRLGLLEGDEVVLEERDGGLFLRPVIGADDWLRLQARAGRGSLERLHHVLSKVSDAPAAANDQL